MILFACDIKNIDMNSYPELTVPKHIEQDNSKMSLEDVQNYFEWFMAIKDKRLSIFYNQVFRSEKVEFSEDKLQAIFYFFRENLTTKQLIPEEVERKRLRLPKKLQKIHKVLDYEFIEPTYTMMFDAGIYLGELLIKTISGLNWVIEKDDEMAHFGEPILMKKGMTIDANPTAVFYVMALKIKEGDIKEDFLLEAFNTNKDKFEGKTKDYMAMINSWTKDKK